MMRRLGPVFALCAVSCASAPPPATPEPAATPAAESQASSAPMDVDATSAELERAESDLQRALAMATTPGAGEAAPRTPGVPAEPKSAEQRSGDPCHDACQALGSMRRSASHLCGLTGETDARCEAAKARVSRADERVRASCPSCRG